MSPPQSFASLPDVVLREILGYLLVDTKREPNRAAVLSTCSTLHDIGLPLLYRVVDVIAKKSQQAHVRFASHLAALFGAEGGLLTERAKRPELSRVVVELRIGWTDFGYERTASDVSGGEISLPDCTTLKLHYGPQPPAMIKHILPQLSAVVDFTFRVEDVWSRDPEYTPLENYGYNPVLAQELGITTSSNIWPALQSVIFDGFVPHDEVHITPSAPNQVSSRLSFADWPFKVLTINLPKWTPEDPWPEYKSHPTYYDMQASPYQLFDLFFSPPVGAGDFLAKVERIDFRLSTRAEKVFRKDTKTIRKRKKIDEARDRILSLIVIVRQDGTTKKLLE